MNGTNYSFYLHNTALKIDKHFLLQTIPAYISINRKWNRRAAHFDKLLEKWYSLQPRTHFYLYRHSPTHSHTHSSLYGANDRIPCYKPPLTSRISPALHL